MKSEARRAVGKLHKEVERWFADAAKLEAQGKEIPAGTMRRRMQGIGWSLKHIERLMDDDTPSADAT